MLSHDKYDQHSKNPSRGVFDAILKLPNLSRNKLSLQPHNNQVNWNPTNIEDKQFLAKMKSARQRILSNRLPTRKNNRNTTIQLKNEKNKNNKMKKNSGVLELEQLQEYIDNQKPTLDANASREIDISLRDCLIDFKMNKSLQQELVNEEQINYLLKKKQVEKQLNKKSLTKIIYITEENRDKIRSAGIELLERLRQEKINTKKKSLSMKSNRYRTVDIQNNNNLYEQEHFSSNLKRLHSFDKNNKKGDFEVKMKSSIFVELPLESLSLPRQDTILPNIKAKKKLKHPPYQRKVQRRRLRENGCVGTRMQIQEWQSKNNQGPKNQIAPKLHKSQRKMIIDSNPQMIPIIPILKKNKKRDFLDDRIDRWEMSMTKQMYYEW